MNHFFLGDVLKILKEIDSNSVDLGITSPPYNKMEKHNGGLVSSVKYDKYKDSMSEKDYQRWQIEVLDELYRIIKPGCSFFYNHKIRYLNGTMLHPLEWLKKTKWRLRQEIIWNRDIAGNIRGWRFWPIEERIYWLYKPINKNDKGKELMSKHALLTSIWDIRPEMKNKMHPAPFPLEVPLRIIFSIFDIEDSKTIIDPFIGSGTTALAAKFLNHNFLGIDISEQYINQSKIRLENMESERAVVDREISLHKVNKTYKQRKEARKK